MTPERLFALLAGGFGFSAVAAGAFGAHALKARLTPELLAVFDTGAKYHLAHAVALAALAALAPQLSPGWSRAAGWLWTLGIVVFSGSLYVLALTGTRTWGAVTPFGGLLLLAGWFALVAAALK